MASQTRHTPETTIWEIGLKSGPAGNLQVFLKPHGHSRHDPLTLAELAAIPRAQVKAMRGVGALTLERIEEAFRDAGLWWVE